jgi:hypothetical protein
MALNSPLIELRTQHRSRRNRAVARTGTAGFDTRRSGFSRLAHGEKALEKKTVAAPRLKPSAFLDTRVVYSGDNLEPIIKRSRKSSAS